jgi:hypothetical protein
MLGYSSGFGSFPLTYAPPSTIVWDAWSLAISQAASLKLHHGCCLQRAPHSLAPHHAFALRHWMESGKRRGGLLHLASERDVVPALKQISLGKLCPLARHHVPLLVVAWHCVERTQQCRPVGHPSTLSDNFQDREMEIRTQAGRRCTEVGVDSRMEFQGMVCCFTICFCGNPSNLRGGK